MTAYLDVGVQRIGEYLTRVPRLKQLRGASAAITAATDLTDPAWRDLVQGTVTINDETGRADGVLHLVVATGDVESAAREVLTVLREQLPGAQLHAAWAQAGDYPTAHALMRESGAAHLDWLPSTNEFPIARPCGNQGTDDRGCGSRPGGAAGRVAALCPDCQRRGSGGAEAEASEMHRGRAETLLAGLGRSTRSIQDLCPRGGRPPASNHVASIAIDGNGVGGYFARLITDGDSQARRQVSRALAQATESAFVAAAAHVTREGRVGVIPVVLGGDDVVVLTSAVDAWDFVRTFQGAFDDAILRNLGDSSGVSSTAGIVLHQAKAPVTQTIALADALMRRAKRVHHGQRAAVAWVDTTVDALDEQDAIDGRPALSFDVLEANRDALTALAGLGHSALANLRREVQELASIPISDADRRDYVHYRASRVGGEPEVRAFAYPDEPGPGQLSLEVALDLARWWNVSMHEVGR